MDVMSDLNHSSDVSDVWICFVDSIVGLYLSGETSAQVHCSGALFIGLQPKHYS